ncbi:MAG: CDP-glycerol glycerophosphotransferase family protein [Nitrospinae bacterium]|nr:CDP-glycerol glycerophosphotransferase family protein [Nitrospinota bacterium]
MAEPGFSLEWPLRPEWIKSTAPVIQQTRARPAMPNVNRVAFAMHNTELINHYGPIMRKLAPAEYDIVYVAANEAERREMESFAQGLGCNAVPAALALSEGRVYDAAVGVHYGSAGTAPDGAPALFRLAVTQIRLMYSIGKDAWLFSDDNYHYNIILCFGPYHLNNLLPFTNAKKVSVGYPRFDNFFNNPPDRAAALKSMGLDPARETIVWLPTHGALCSVREFAKAIGELSGEYNVAIKLHPLTAVSDPASIAALEEAGLNNYFSGSFDNSNLFSIADYVIADYGGSSFGAIYTGKNLVLLDVAAAAGNENITGESSSVELRRWFPHYGAGEADKIRTALQNKTLWSGQAKTSAALRDRFFAPHYGFSSDVAAMAIRNHRKITGAEK